MGSLQVDLSSIIGLVLSFNDGVLLFVFAVLLFNWTVLLAMSLIGGETTPLT